MRILLDECLPKRLKRDLVGHEATSVPEMGWAGKTNGALLTLAHHTAELLENWQLAKLGQPLKRVAPLE